MKDVQSFALTDVNILASHFPQISKHEGFPIVSPSYVCLDPPRQEVRIESIQTVGIYRGDSLVNQNTSCICVFLLLQLVGNFWVEIIHGLQLLPCKQRMYTSAC